ncbi:MAG: PHB depolymerase family esterase [Acidobacteriota bacterium]|nr:PHB depolymerase family esterase [Acidobacteriota bacterium]
MTTTQLLETVEQEPTEPAEACVIWLHGLGADGNDFVSLPPELGTPSDLPIRYVFPHAPEMSVTLNMGMRMRAWYDIVSLDSRGQDEPGIRRSAASIADLVGREIARGVPSSRIVLAGFSQGAAMALFTGLRYPEPLAGIVALSGYLPLLESLSTEAAAANRELEVFQAHGRHDDVVPQTLGRECADHLRSFGYAVTWHDYAMAHEVCLEEIQEIGRWLVTALTRDRDK